jgi:DNA-binding transcriptional MocR family regulator
MSVERRSQLLNLARQYNMVIITDDVYDLLTYTSDPIPPRLVTLDSPTSTETGYGNTISNCSFSKLLAPGLRFGFIQGRKALIRELSTQYGFPFEMTNNSGATMSGGCPSQFTASCLTCIISNGMLDTRIEHLKYVYSNRAKVYLGAIEKYWGPLGVQCNPCKGGYFFWVRLPSSLTSDVVAEEGMKENVQIMEGTNCAVPGDNSVEYDRYIRICLALEEEEEAVKGIRQIGKVFQRLMQT